MKNTEMFRFLISNYHALSATDNYIYGFTFNGMVYAVFTDHKTLAMLCTLDKASRGAGYALRFKPNKAVKAMLMAMNPELICSVDYFNGLVAESRYNKGEIFEKLMTEYFGQTWEKDSVPFTVQGDINVDGIEYQVKYEGATFTNERLLHSLMGE